MYSHKANPGVPAPSGEGNTFFALRDLCKSYRVGDEMVPVLNDVNLKIERGEYLSVVGPSGSGKSTLMNIIGCLDVATSGEYILNGREIGERTETELARIRNREIGFVFQNSQLLARMDAQKNVELPLVYQGVGRKERAERAREMLVRVGLENRRHHFSNQLSGGPTSPPARWIKRRAGRSWSCLSASTTRAAPSSSSPTT